METPTAIFSGNKFLFSRFHQVLIIRYELFREENIVKEVAYCVSIA
jgi:hypothetical protein